MAETEFGSLVVCQNTDGLGLRLQRADELQLALHGQFIAGAGHIAGIQLGLYRVGNGGKMTGMSLFSAAA